MDPWGPVEKRTKFLGAYCSCFSFGLGRFYHVIAVNDVAREGVVGGYLSSSLACIYRVTSLR